jgi:hypothetical protein
MSILRALGDGLVRVLSAPAILMGVYLATLGLAVPAGLMLRASVADHLGTSVTADALVEGVDIEWWDEFVARASGLDSTFNPSILGGAAVLSNISALADHLAAPPAVTMLVAAHVIVWMFLLGGILDRYARCRAIGAVGFFAACGVYFIRFCRLALIAGPIYWLALAVVQPWLIDDVYPRLTAGLTAEPQAFYVRLGLYAVVGAILLAVNLVLDYAKVRAVVEDRRSMIGAALAGLRFVRRRPVAAVTLYLANVALLAGLLAIYAAAAPDAALPGTGPMWVIFLIGQLYIVGRLLIRLLFLASQTSYFQGQLAHASYSATPNTVWPDPPVVEAVGRTS